MSFSFANFAAFNLKYLQQGYARLALALPDRGFLALLNLYCLGARSGVRFAAAPDGRGYAYHDRKNGKTIRFRHRTRAMKYHRGIRHRAETLAKDYMLDRIAFRAGDTVIDCGANIGELRHWFGFRGVEVRYIAFEPSPLEYEALLENAPDAEAHNIGLWHEDGEIGFYISSEEADSSLIPPAHYDGVIRVKTERLDRHVTGTVRLLKLEAEGAEPEILEGLGERLGLIHYIAADLGFERGRNKESTLAPVTNFLLARGFSLVELRLPRLTALFVNDRFGAPAGPG